MSIFKGWFGEKAATFGMWLSLDSDIYRRFHDVIVPTRNGTTQIDHLLVSPYGLFVIETKSYSGWIFGSEDHPKWTQSFYRKKFSFQNPLRQNHRHIKCLAEYLRLPSSVFHSVVLFVGDCEFKTPMPPNVMKSGMRSYIRSFHDPLLSGTDNMRIVSAISALKSDPYLTRDSHIRSLRDRHESTTQCPRCGAALVVRTARKGQNIGGQFYGCSDYPKCRYTRNV